MTPWAKAKSTNERAVDPLEHYYVLVARHGPWEHSPFLADAAQHLSHEGQVQVRDIAKTFAEHMNLLPANERIRIGEIWHSRPHYSRDTAVLFSAALRLGLAAEPPPPTLVAQEDLNPGAFWSRTPNDRERHIQNVSKSVCEKLTSWSTGDNQRDSNAVLLVSHQPLLGRVAEQFLGVALPLARSELVCIRVTGAVLQSIIAAFPDSARTNASGRSMASGLAMVPPLRRFIDRRRGRKRRLLWSIEPTNPEVAERLRAKIAAKIDVAKVLGALITAVLALTISQILGQLVDPDKASKLTMDAVFVFGTVGSAILFLAAEVLYLRSIYAYDSLLMPTRFWAEGSSRREVDWVPRRPPSSENYILYVNMLRIWNWLFTPATLCLVGGIALLGYAVLHRLLGAWSGELVSAGVAILIGAVVWFLNAMGEPHFGAQD
jgi:hypothetical protein